MLKFFSKTNFHSPFYLGLGRTREKQWVWFLWGTTFHHFLRLRFLRNSEKIDKLLVFVNFFLKFLRNLSLRKRLSNKEVLSQIFSLTPSAKNQPKNSKIWVNFEGPFFAVGTIQFWKLCHPKFWDHSLRLWPFFAVGTILCLLSQVYLRYRCRWVTVYKWSSWNSFRFPQTTFPRLTITGISHSSLYNILKQYSNLFYFSLFQNTHEQITNPT